MAFTNYSTTAEVRAEAGFEANEDIETSVIQGYLDDATAVIQSHVAARYNLSSFNTNFEGSQAEKWLQNVEKKLAAGYLLNKEYGLEDDGITGKGDQKVEMAMEMLKMLDSGQINLLDDTGAEYEKVNNAGAGSATSFPQSSKVQNSDGQQINRTFSVGDFY